ncbi:MAG: Ig-like domain-containing protein [Pseudomonadota bacterium]
MVVAPENGIDLILTIAPTGARITLPNRLIEVTAGVDIVAFDDGAMWDYDVLLTLSEPGGPSSAPPVAADDAANVAEDGSFLIEVLANDADANSDGLSILALGAASNGTVSLECGEIRYTPEGDFAGADAFTYEVSDGYGEVATATVAVNATVAVDATPVNDAPLLTSPTVIDVARKTLWRSG